MAGTFLCRRERVIIVRLVLKLIVQDMLLRLVLHLTPLRDSELHLGVGGLGRTLLPFVDRVLVLGIEQVGERLYVVLLFDL